MTQRHADTGSETNWDAINTKYQSLSDKVINIPQQKGLPNPYYNYLLTETSPRMFDQKINPNILVDRQSPATFLEGLSPINGPQRYIPNFGGANKNQTTIININNNNNLLAPTSYFGQYTTEETLKQTVPNLFNMHNAPVMNTQSINYNNNYNQ